jgi:hypothetical protein
MNPFIKTSQLKTKLPGYQVARSYALNHQTLQHLAARHHEKFLKAFKYVQANVITTIQVSKGIACRKYDGIAGFFYWETGQQPFLFHNTFGAEVGLPAVEELAAALQKAGHKSALLVGELSTAANRSHSYDVIRAINSPQRLEDLRNVRFVIFDVILLDKADIQTKDYAERVKVLRTLPSTPLAFVPEFKEISSLKELNEFYSGELAKGQEGIVYHELATQTAYKVKSLVNLDLAIVGYVEGTDELAGQAVSIMGALVSDGCYQLVARVGVADPAVREPLFQELSRNRAESDYVETDSDSRPIVWVKPTKVVEINAEDVTWQDTRGGHWTNAVLKLDGARFLYQGQGEILKPFHPTMERIRDDKTPAACTFAQLPGTALKLLKAPADGASKQILREVYTKALKGKNAVKKIVAWENQNNGGPKFVIHTVDYSSGRADALQEDTKVTNERAEVDAFVKSWKDEEIGKGWAAA